jgi:hypothetical protein
MQKLVLLFLVIFSTNAVAATVKTKIYEVLSPELSDQDYLLLATDGVVYEVSPSETELIEMAYQAKEDGTEIEMSLKGLSAIKNVFNMRDRVGSIKMLSTMSVDADSSLQNDVVPTPLDGYQSSSLNDMDFAKRVFNSMRKDTRRRSQCYNRAHVWTYEAYNRFRLNSRKIWLFFTRRYIREYNYKWWFHVTPSILVDGASEDIALDRQFTQSPLPLTDWKNEFMYNNADCKEVKFYSDYYENQWDAYCYVIKSSMYYWQPFNIENLEKEGPEKKSWVQSEIDRAYSNAIRGRWFE